MGEESTVPGSLTVTRRRPPTLALEIPVAASETPERWGSRPNSGQSRSVLPGATAAAGRAAADGVGVDTSAGARPPQAASSAQPDEHSASRVTPQRRIDPWL